MYLIKDSNKEEEEDDDDNQCFNSFPDMKIICKKSNLTSNTLYRTLLSYNKLEEKINFLLIINENNNKKQIIIKNNEISAELREKGNHYYKTKDFKKALEYYTLSITTAEPKSEDLAIAMSNKSACLFKIGHPRACLLHIQKIVTQLFSVCPEKVRANISQRTHDVIEMIFPKALACFNEMGDPTYLRFLRIFLTNGPEAYNLCHFINEPILDCFINTDYIQAESDNSKLKGFSSKVRLIEDEKYGRHIVAYRKLYPGDVILISPNYTRALYSDIHRLDHCSHCLLFTLTVSPCPKCSYDMYCSSECYKSSIKYNWALCPLGEQLFFGSTEPNGKLKLALKLLFSALYKYRGKMMIFKEEVSKYDSELTDSRIKGTSKNGIFDGTEDFRTIYYMWSQPDSLDENVKNSLLISATYAINCITENPDFFSKESNLSKSMIFELKLFFTKLLYKILIGLEWNSVECYEFMHLISRTLRTSSFNECIVKYKKNIIGLMYCSKLGLFNHECYSNCLYVYNDKQITVQVIKQIHKGEQLTIPYFNYWSTKNELRLKIFDRMKFKCECIACKFNWNETCLQLSSHQMILRVKCPLCKEIKIIQSDKSSIKCNKCGINIDGNKIRNGIQEILISFQNELLSSNKLDIKRVLYYNEIINHFINMCLPFTCSQLIILYQYLIITISEKYGFSYCRPVEIFQQDEMKQRKIKTKRKKN